MLSWFDAREAKEFGASLACFFIERMPPDAEMGEKAFTLKADKVLAKMAGQVLRFRQRGKLNSYKKAQLGNAFKWTLLEAGFSASYTEKLTKWLVLQV